MGSILSAWIAGTLAKDLTPVVPNIYERETITRSIIAGANPRAQVAEVAPARPIRHPNPRMEAAIRKVAERDFVIGIRIALAVAIALLATVFVAGLLWLPRKPGAAIADAQREAALEREP